MKAYKPKQNKFLQFFIFLAIIATASCDDSTDTIGSGIGGNMDNFIVTSDTFLLSSFTAKVDSVLARNAKARFGCVKDPETGALISSNYMTQFYILPHSVLPELDSMRSFRKEVIDELFQRKTDGSNEIDTLAPLKRKVQISDLVADSIYIQIYPTSIIGDSLRPMQMAIYELDKPMLENRQYYSNFDPMKEGYLDSRRQLARQTFALTDKTVDSLTTVSSGYVPYFQIALNQPYNDGKGNTLNDGQPYNNFGTYLLRKYYDGVLNHGENYFENFNTFMHKVCPGIYIKHENGVGAMANISATRMVLYFHYWQNDSLPNVGSFTIYEGTQEVLQTTNYSSDKSVLEQALLNNECTYMKTPDGLYTEVELPILDIMRGHENDSISSAKVSFGCMNYQSIDDYKFPQSQNILMIPADSVTTFFEKRGLNDGKTAFLASYASSTNSYTFNNIAGIITYLKDCYDKGMAKNPNWATEPEHLKWNRVALVPVETTTTSSSSISAIYNNLGLTNTRLVGGQNNPLDAIKLSVIYNRFCD